MASREQRIGHLLRRAAFGASRAQLDAFTELGTLSTIDSLLDYPRIPDTVDSLIGAPGHLRTSSEFRPYRYINHAAQRWVFRMVHSGRPLQERMTLFWHSYFPTSYRKIAGEYGDFDGTRLMASKAAEDPTGQRGQIEMLRAVALGSFYDLVVRIAQDPAMLIWLDGRDNVKDRPQENFAREVMEIFSMGVGTFTEDDVRAGARVFTGWNLRRVGASGTPKRYEFVYNAAEHDTATKTFSFPIYGGANKTIPARSADAGLQDGYDLLLALARHPETARRLARRLYEFFVDESAPAPSRFVQAVESVYFQSGLNMTSVVRTVLTSPEFNDPSNFYTRYSWPAEFTARVLRETGTEDVHASRAVDAMRGMGQELYAPPHVGGWSTGPSWFTSGTMISRMNFVAYVVGRARQQLLDECLTQAGTPATLLGHAFARWQPAPFEQVPYHALLGYLSDGTSWTQNYWELYRKAPGVAHLIQSSANYQLV